MKKWRTVREWTYIKRTLNMSSRSSHKFQAASVIVYYLTAAWAKSCPTSHACVVCRTPTNWAVVAPRWGARWTHCSPQICWDMRRQGFKICLLQFKTKNYFYKYLQNKHDIKETCSSALLTSCNTSINDLAALFSKAFPCLVLRFIILDCFFCMRTVESYAESKRWLLDHSIIVNFFFICRQGFQIE